MEYIDFVNRICACFGLSLLIGFERQWGRHAIGLQTNVLVSLGAFLFASFSTLIQTDGDVTRIAAQVVSGIGFLGAGVIIKDGGNIRGLNTAATLWCNAAIGVLCAGGLLIEATTGCIAILFSNIFLRMITNKLSKSRKVNQEYLFKIKCEDDKELRVRNIISKATKNVNLTLENIETKTIENGMVKETEGDTSIFIYPGYEFKCIDRLITNFHLPESTLIMLVSALAGKEKVMNAYNEAVKERYRFFSFGDSMIIK